MRPHAFFGKCVLAGVAALAALAPFGAAHAGVTFLHAFAGGTDGAEPRAGLVEDKAGNFYGTTQVGGSNCFGGGGCGTVFKLAPDGTETVLHSFTETGGDGLFPSGLIKDNAGNLYGTTPAGGVGGGGTVFKIAPDGTETILYSFQGQKDGMWPDGGVMRDSAGNLYGTTEAGGVTGCYNGQGCGTVFKLAPDGTETVLYAFAGGSDGEYPYMGVVMDKAGNLYGTTPEGGADNDGIIFKVDPHGKETVLHTFAGGSDGAGPHAGLIKDDAGNLYGTTTGGDGCLEGYGCGTVFKLSPDGTEMVLYSFKAGSDGAYPQAGVIRDRAGNLYGTTQVGGGTGCVEGCGTVFRLTPDGTETVLLALHNWKQGSIPQASLMADKTGHLYGTTIQGGSKTACDERGCGTIFRLNK